MKPIFLFVCLFLAAAVNPVIADDLQEDLMHIAAHAGGTYIMTHGTQVICKKLIGKDKKLTCTIVGIVLAQSVNIAYKAKQGFPSDTTRSLSSGAAGSAAAALMIAIDF